MCSWVFINTIIKGPQSTLMLKEARAGRGEGEGTHRCTSSIHILKAVDPG